MTTSRLRDLLLLTRPYSWIDAILNTLIGLAWSRGANSLGLRLSVAVIALLMWFSLNWVSEAIQHDPDRRMPGWGLTLAPLFIAWGWTLYLGSSDSLLWLVAYTALIFIYPWKARNSFLGPLGFLLRGVQTGTLFMLGTSFGGASPAVSRIVFSLVLVQAARSLVADIRDVKSDVHELPTLIGERPSKWFAVALLLAGIASMPSLRPGHFEPQLILLGMMVLMVVFRPDYSYELHFGFIMVFAFAKMAIYTELLGEAPYLNWIVLSPLQMALSSTYWHVPRRSNELFREHMERAIRVVGKHY